MSEKKRRKWTAKEKLRIVLTCMQPGVEVSEVCRREGINPTQFYNWKKRLLASASQVFEEKPKKRDVERERIGAGAVPDEGRDRGDHGGEPGAKKNAFGLEDHGKMPPELQQRVHEEVELTKRAERLAGGQDAGGLGREPDDVLSLAARGGVGEGPAGGAAAAGAALRGVAGGEGGGEGVCLETSGAAASGVGLADGGRGRGVREQSRRCIGFCGRRSWFVLGEGGGSVAGRRRRRRAVRTRFGRRTSSTCG